MHVINLLVVGKCNNFYHSRFIIIESLQVRLMSSSFTRKKIENYSYGLGDTIGKGYSSQVYKGRNDDSS